MKKIAHYLLFVLMAFFTIACGNGGSKSAVDNKEPDPEELLQETISDKTNLPSLQIMDVGLVLTDAELDDKYLILEYTCDETQISLEVFNGNKDLVKQAILEELEQKGQETSKVVDLLKDTHRGISCKYVGDKSGKSVTIYVEPDELCAEN